MRGRDVLAPWSAAQLAAFVLVAACGGDDMTGGGGNGGGDGNISDPATFETEMRDSFVPITLGLIDGFDRLVAALEGGAQDGVTLIPDGGGGVDATVQVDLDGNGSRESSIAGAASGTLATGIQVVVGAVTDPALPSLSVSLSMRAIQTGATSVLVDQIGGTMSADPPGSGNAAEATLTDGSVSLSLATGNPDGFIDASITGEGSTLGVSVTFESDGSGGWRARFVGEGFNFTVP